MKMKERVSVITQSADGCELLKQIQDYVLSTHASLDDTPLVSFRGVKWIVISYSFPFGEIILERVNEKGANMAEQDNKLLHLSGDAELGKTIVKAAQDKRRQRLSDQVVHIVDSLFEGVEVHKRRSKFHEMIAEGMQARITAIEAGEFALSPRGKLSYNDEKLNQPIPTMSAADPSGEAFERMMNNLGRKL